MATGEPKLPRPRGVYSAVNDGGKPLKVVYWKVLRMQVDVMLSLVLQKQNLNLKLYNTKLLLPSYTF